ncbi:MAG: glycosyltransferase, partial [Bacteroidetes bacterium]|nr:glycosyltransferase [Bacteroidota bacterium]
MSLPYFSQCGWDAEVVTIDPKYSEMPKDDLLLQSIPPGIKIHYVDAMNKGWTSKFGLGSIALRSLRFYRKKVNELLKKEHFDLIYFSTTQFPVCILGAYWKKRFGVPYVIDMQDPWHSDYYQNKPKDQRPKKYWFSYRLNKRLEPKAMRTVDGLISVSESYITTLKERYPEISHIPAETITFGAFEPDMEIAEKHKDSFPQLFDPPFVNIVYIGRGGTDMRSAITPLFMALRDGLDTHPGLFDKIRL